MNETKQVIFAIGNEEYGIDVSYVSAIDKYVNIIYVPNAPQFIEGMINIRGDVIPIYSLRARFGLPPKEPDINTNIIVVRINQLQVGFLVDAMHEIVELPYKDLVKPSPLFNGEGTAYIEWISNINGRMIVLLDLKRILSDSEIEDIEEIIKQS